MKEGILGMDIGGTNTSIEVFDLNLKQIQSFKEETSRNHPYEFLKRIIIELRKQGIGIHAAGICAAGPIKKGTVSLTNAKRELSLKIFKKILGIKLVILMNDFEGAAFGINTLKKKEMVTLNDSKQDPKGVKVILGAGTGLGKAVLVFNEKKKIFIPLKSEEGHSSFCPTIKEFELVKFIEKKNKNEVVWEDLLSGRGIENIYDFLKKKSDGDKKTAKLISQSNDKAKIISEYSGKDSRCKETFTIFSKIYARFIRNSILQSLPFGGVYITGGIARKNLNIFSSKEFKKELYKSSVYLNIIQRIPITIITSNIGSKGAGFCAKKKFLS